MARLNLIAVLSLMFLSACANFTGEPDKIACPDIFILKDTDRVARFLPDGEKPSIKNLVYEARSTFGDGTCKIKNDGTLSLEFAVGAYVKTAPLFEDEKAQELNQELEMYVGIRNNQGNIISRKAVALDLQKGKKGDDGEEKGTPLLRAFLSDKSRYDDAFPKNLLRVSSVVKVDILTNPTEDPRDYKIYLGFRITKTELQFNRNGYLPSF